ncbi:hypothetical protein ACI798_02970 [Geodermatophilus sp. SYSU D01045]
MSLSTTPAPARTDAAAPRSAAPAARPVASVRSVRRAGIAVATGSAAWAAGILAFGIDPTVGSQALAYEMTALLFQLGLVALVTVQLWTGAIGTGRLARAALHLEHVLLSLAILSTLSAAFLPGHAEEAWYLALDAFWPLSMVGMFLIGIRIAIAGRWSGAARWWPLGAKSWAPVNIPVAQIAPSVVAYTAAGHLLVGYVALGIVLATRPELTGAR